MSHYAQFVVELTILALAIFLGDRGDLEGADAPAHAADVGNERDPRHRDRRRAPDRGHGRPDLLVGWIGFVAMILAAANVVGGFVVTDRMLEMFKQREPPKKKDDGRTA